MRKISFLNIILLLGDISLMYLALLLALFIRNKNLASQFNTFFNNFLFLYVLWIFIIFILSLYDINFFKKSEDFFFNVIIFSVVAFFLGVTFFYFRPDFGLTPKTILLLDVLIFDILFIFWRYCFNLFLEASGVKEKVIIIGSDERLKEIFPRLKRIYEVVSLFCPTDSGGQKKCLFNFSETNTVSKMSDLKKVVADKKVTSIIFALDFYSNEDLAKEIFSNLPLTLNYIGADDLYEFIAKKVSLNHLNEIWFLENVARSENIFERVVKRLFDVLLSILGSFLFIIVFPFAALAIKLDSEGHVFYPQGRVGKNGKIFIIHKFRTMVEKKSQDKELWREKNKNSITRIGKILRRTHIDELPQSWSILKGDLSFVGPRPEWTEMAKEFEKEIPFYKQRYLVKPGIIGWAQINFPASRSTQEAKEKFEYDLYYIKNRSLLLDMEIILKAMKSLFW
jgi:exopolysaccharide biosynthesis polyprenyl glycosylphosphotransferase